MHKRNSRFLISALAYSYISVCIFCYFGNIEKAMANEVKIPNTQIALALAEDNTQIAGSSGTLTNEIKDNIASNSTSVVESYLHPTCQLININKNKDKVFESSKFNSLEIQASSSAHPIDLMERLTCSNVLLSSPKVEGNFTNTNLQNLVIGSSNEEMKNLKDIRVSDGLKNLDAKEVEKESTDNDENTLQSSIITSINESVSDNGSINDNTDQANLDLATKKATSKDASALEMADPTNDVVFSENANLKQWYEKYGQQYGVDPIILEKIASCESGERAQAVNGPYGGIFQFVTSTWISNRKAMGEDPNPALRFNAEESIKTAAFKMGRDGYGAWPACSRKVLANS